MSGSGPTIDKELIERLAGLARLGLAEDERETLRDELESLLGHFQALQEVDTEGVEPLAHVLTATGEPGVDAVDPFEHARDRLVDAAAVHREGFFVVPRVVEGPEREATDDDAAPVDPDPADELD